MVNINVQKLENYSGPDDLTPAYPGDAGIDLYATHGAVLRPGERAQVKCGIALALPEGVEGQVRPRSGNALHLGLQVHLGTVDSTYRGEVGAILYNMNPAFPSEFVSDLFKAIRRSGIPSTVKAIEDQLNQHVRKHTITIRPGDRIAQLVLNEHVSPQFQWADSLDETERGEQGYGSSGLVGEEV